LVAVPIAKVEHIVLVEVHLQRDQPASPEAMRRGEAARERGRGTEPHLYVDRDGALVAVGTVRADSFDFHHQKASVV
jgi:hypothetical protein